MAATPAITPEPAAAEPQDDEVIPVELGGTIKLVPRATVRYVEAQGDYARLHTSDASHLVRVSLATLADRHRYRTWDTEWARVEPDWHHRSH